MSAMVTINGRTVKVGKNVNIIDGKIISDGMVVSQFDNSEGVTIENIEGSIGKLECHYPLVVHGAINGNVMAYRPVNCGDINGHLKADGPVNCGDVRGSLKASGPVNCGDIGGNFVK